MELAVRLVLFFLGFTQLCSAQTNETTTQLSSSEPSRIEAHLYNDARVPIEVSGRAERTAMRVLKGAGIEVEWSDCTVVGGNPESNLPACTGPLHSGDVFLYFVGPLEQHFSWVDGAALGYSIIPDAGGLATMAYISYPRIQKLSASTSAGVADLLGLAMAHEIGHLLFQSREHANQGIMRATWRLRDLQAKAWEEFQFTPDQAQRMRAAVRERSLGHRRETGDESRTLANSYAVFGASSQQEALVHSQIQIMQPAVLPLRVFFVPHWKYVDNTRVFQLHVPAGYTSALFTHLPSRTIFIDADRYFDESLGYWLAHELGHLVTNSAKEDDAEKAAREFRRRLRLTQQRYTLK